MYDFQRLFSKRTSYALTQGSYFACSCYVSTSFNLEWSILAFIFVFHDIDIL